MNDVNRGLYSRSKNSEPGIEKTRQENLDLYHERMEKIIKILLKNNSKVILQKPTIYDQPELCRK